MKKAKNKAFFYLQNTKIYVNILKQKKGDINGFLQRKNI